MIASRSDTVTLTTDPVPDREIEAVSYIPLCGTAARLK